MPPPADQGAEFLSPVRGWLLGLLLVLTAFLAYQPAWTGKPIWDDDANLTKPELRSSAGLARIWIEPGATLQYYPLVYSVFWVEHKLWGDSTLGYHLVNILLHATAALLLLELLRTLRFPAPWLAAAIFALHPVQVESVAWISEIKNTLSAVFYFGSALACLRFDRTRSKAAYAGALALFVPGLLSKTAIATLPAALLVVFWWQRGKLSWKQHVLPLIPFFAAGITAGFFTSWTERYYGAQGPEFNFSILERFLIAGRAIWFYLGKLFWPADLIFCSYPRWNISQRTWWQYLFPAAALLLGALWVLRRRGRGPLAALLFFVGTLFPTLGFFNVFLFRYSFVADHFQYLASIGPILLASVGIHTCFRGFRERRRLSEAAFCATLLAALCLLSWRQSRMYTDAETLWRTTIDRNPASWMARNNLACALLQKGRMDEAIIQFQKALAIRPDDAKAHYDLGDALFQKGQVDQAILHFQKALAIQPDFADAHNNLGAALFQKGQVDQAIIQFQKALAIQPHDAEVHLNLGNALRRKGQTDDAILHFQKALAIQPHSVEARGALARIAWLLATSPNPSLRNGTKAIELARQTDQLAGGGNPRMAATLAAAYAEAGRFDQAIAAAQRALQLATRQDNAAMVAAIEAQLKCYQAGSPFRDTGASP